MGKYILAFSNFSYSFLIPEKEVYHPLPLKIPLHLSNSFAELRNNHFNSGIDIKTHGRAGIPVYCAAGGCPVRHVKIDIKHTQEQFDS